MVKIIDDDIGGIMQLLVSRYRLTSSQFALNRGLTGNDQQHVELPSRGVSICSATEFLNKCSGI